MLAEMATTRDPLDDLRKLKTAEGRLNWLGRYLGPKTLDKAELHHRALFATRVREAGLWPK